MLNLLLNTEVPEKMMLDRFLEDNPIVAIVIGIALVILAASFVFKK